MEKKTLYTASSEGLILELRLNYLTFGLQTLFLVVGKETLFIPTFEQTGSCGFGSFVNSSFLRARLGTFLWLAHSMV